MGAFSEKVKRLDAVPRGSLLKKCRLKTGGVWRDSVSGHAVACADASDAAAVARVFGRDKAALIINDPPYNVAVGGKNTKNLSRVSVDEYIKFSRKWLDAARQIADKNAHLYVWLGADVKRGFQPLPEFMMLMREFEDFKARNFITMRNQRGFGTQKNWMWVRQELLHYTKGSPKFKVIYTDIPKILQGYYKKVNGKVTDNISRGKSKFIRPGNVWVDIQQVFYRMEENVPGCYAQKPLKAIERIVESSSVKGDTVADFFSHSGTTLIAGERLGRRVITFDNDPVFAEITIRRLERFRETGKTGWQSLNPLSQRGEGGICL